MRFRLAIALLATILLPVKVQASATEFCLRGEFNLGLRLQAHQATDSWFARTWCVVTEDDSQRVFFAMTGQSNPDAQGDWAAAYEPPSIVRIVNRDAPPDVEFQGTNNLSEALTVRRLDPHRLLEEHLAKPIEDVRVDAADGRLRTVHYQATLPVHGVVTLTWRWTWTDPAQPGAVLSLNGEPLFRGTGSWRQLSSVESEAVWRISPGPGKIEVPGDRWPSRVNLQWIDLAEDVYLVRGVRTGFQHLVVDTAEGLVVADAPASWLEFHQIPAQRFVAELGIDGIAEGMVAFIQQQLPERRIRAVALTHFHDDHAGGAVALARAGAQVYAPSAAASFLQGQFRQRRVPAAERTSNDRNAIDILPLDDTLEIGTPGNRVRLVPLGANPHVDGMLGVWAVDRNYFFVSDIHVPRNEDGAPTAERAATECWFARWASTNLPESVQVLNSHSPVITPLSRLREYLESEVCQALDGE